MYRKQSRTGTSFILDHKQPSYLSLSFMVVKSLIFSDQDAMDELNGRTYDGRELRIKIDEGRPK